MGSALGRSRDDEIPPLETENGEKINDDEEKATLLNEYSVTQLTLNIPDTQEPPPYESPNVPMPTLENLVTSEQSVLKIVNSLDENKSTGPDEILVKLVELIALLIAKPLSDLFNKSLLNGCYPSKFKEANIKPIFKRKGTPSDYKCYRPIGILSVLSKVFEKKNCVQKSI